MSHEVSELEPKVLWKHFYSLTQIPRPSGKEAEVAEFVRKFGESLNLETIVDSVGNVIIKKPACPGMENKKTVCMQGHLDMVPQKNSDTVHDFEKDPLKPFVDGEWVTAEGTTLGADNGIGLAAAMAVLESKDILHGPVEVLFTIDEESGMTGAFGLKGGLLDGDILLNMDSEDEGELYIGCAGGIDTMAVLKYSEVDVPKDSIALEIKVTGLRGGHSGLDINTGRGNAIKVLNRFLFQAAPKHNLRLASIEGGTLRNAIPREAFTVITLPKANETPFKNDLEAYANIVKAELSITETGLKIEAVPSHMPATLIDEKAQENLIKSIYGCPNGVFRMSDAVEGLVETSTNIAIVKSEKGKIDIISMQRSSVNTSREDLCAMIRSVFELAGAEVNHDGAYPGWKPNPESPILKIMQKAYEDKYGNVPDVKAIHAGLECGLISDVYPDMDMISFGPTIHSPHSPDEKVNIETVGKFWNFLVETLKNIEE
ncbi:MAG: aminoacyl-histidine dipeptidase [bacterium]|nr:aminoacyl-histidine dipeptidase [bacterium]